MPAFKDSSFRTGGDSLDYVCEQLSIKPTMVAALLSVTERTLNNWKNKPILESPPPRMMRLSALQTVVSVALEKGVPSQEMLSFLNEPIDDEGMSLLGYIVDEPDNRLLKRAAEGLAEEF